MGQSPEHIRYRDALRRAGLGPRPALVRLLGTLSESDDTHLSLSEVQALTARYGLTVTVAELSRQLEQLVEHGLIGRLPTTRAEPVFDTVPEPHSHLVYADTSQVIDLHVSNDTLFALLRRTLRDAPGQVEVMIRVHGPSPEPS